ncbi:hypothetical protein NDU88_001601 [Pleurodeles waltl]|uniref:Uncharacterized protein n=1 Tax=Pleurodeles waltl TaxID=8319 RepID=A0AAV7KT31_PLEWA|nr:hypothetical protein NDU88_001601 [Pleurodeles waltl]
MAVDQTPPGVIKSEWLGSCQSCTLIKAEGSVEVSRVWMSSCPGAGGNLRGRTRGSLSLPLDGFVGSRGVRKPGSARAGLWCSAESPSCRRTAGEAGGGEADISALTSLKPPCGSRSHAA